MSGEDGRACAPHHRRPRMPKVPSASKPAGKASLTVGNKTVELPVSQGTVGPDVIDIRKLYTDANVFTYDPGFQSTASCESADHLHRRRRRRPALSRLSDRPTGRTKRLHRGLLPAAERRAAEQRRKETFRNQITRHTMVHEQISQFFRGFRRDAHPMADHVRRGRRAVGVLPRLDRHQ
jgi:citrate synthase